MKTLNVILKESIKQNTGSKIQKNIDNLNNIIRKIYLIESEIKSNKKAYNELKEALKNLEKAESYLIKITGILD